LAVAARAQCEKIACEGVKSMPLVIENGSFSAHRLVQHCLPQRAPSKII
jgi:hypothetical protein